VTYNILGRLPAREPVRGSRPHYHGAGVSDQYTIAIIGAGPAGLSAAGRAAQLDRAANRTAASYILLEGSPAPAKTIQRYQKGKHVMDEPGFLDLRSDLRFAAGAREQVLEGWGGDIGRLGINIRYSAEVVKIQGQRGDFRIQLADGSTVGCEQLVLAIGLEGNPRKLGAPGEDLPGIQYQLDNPRDYAGETILVVGAGDSAIENALALAEQNTVWIINRGKEFSRAKEANLNAVIVAINDRRRRFSCAYETRIGQIAARDNGPPLEVTLVMRPGDQRIACHRVIARVRSASPRSFLASI